MTTAKEKYSVGNYTANINPGMSIITPFNDAYTSMDTNVMKRLATSFSKCGSQLHNMHFTTNPVLLTLIVLNVIFKGHYLRFAGNNNHRRIVVSWHDFDG